MSQHCDSQDGVDTSFANIPFPASEEPSSDTAVVQDESFTVKAAADALDEIGDSQTSDLPGTPDSMKEIVEKSESLINSLKTTKPVLGKIQAKKRLMAFANKFKTIPKVQKVKPKINVTSKNNSLETMRSKIKSTSNVKMLIDELNNAKSKIEAALDIQDKNEQHSSRQAGKAKKFAGIDIFLRLSLVKVHIYSIGNEVHRIFSINYKNVFLLKYSVAK